MPTASHLSATDSDDNPKCFQVFLNVHWTRTAFVWNVLNLNYTVAKMQKAKSNLDPEVKEEPKKKQNHSTISESK